MKGLTNLFTVNTSTLIAALAFAAAGLDVAAFTQLGDVFAGVMTGNLIMIGLGISHGSIKLAIYSGSALASFCLGAVLGGKLMGQAKDKDTHWPHEVTMALLLELGILAIFSIGWLAIEGRPTGVFRFFLLIPASLALGVQSIAIRRLPTRASTTFLTGTLIGVIMAMTSPHPEKDNPSWRDRLTLNLHGLMAVTFAICGALAGGIILSLAPNWLPILSFIPVAGVATLAIFGTVSPA